MGWVERTRCSSIINAKIASLFSSTLILVLPLVDPQGECGVEQHPAHAAHGLLVIAGAPDTGGAVHGGGVHAALGSPLDPNVAVLAPVGAPRVADKPVREGSAKIF